MANERGQPRGYVRWHNDPGDRDPLWVPILGAKPGAPVTGWIVSSLVEGVLTHYYNRRTHPCTGPHDYCEGHALRIPCRYKGYLGIWVPGPGRYALAELTKHCVASNPLLRSRNVDLRGKRLILRREGKAVNAAVSAEITDAKYGDTLPPAFDVRRALSVVWWGDDGVCYEGGCQP